MSMLPEGGPASGAPEVEDTPAPEAPTVAAKPASDVPAVEDTTGDSYTFLPAEGTGADIPDRERLLHQQQARNAYQARRTGTPYGSIA